MRSLNDSTGKDMGFYLPRFSSHAMRLTSPVIETDMQGMYRDGKSVNSINSIVPCAGIPTPPFYTNIPANKPLKSLKTHAHNACRESIVSLVNYLSSILLSSQINAKRLE